MNELQRMLAANSAYETLVIGRAPKFTSWFYYRRLMGIVLASSRLAKHGLYTKQEWADACALVLRLVEQCGGRVKLHGLVNLQNIQGPVVFIGNHMSTLETFLLPAILLGFTDITFVVKPSLMKYPAFRHVMRSTKPIVIDRQHPRDNLITVLNEGERWLKKGKSVVIFPQSTRSKYLDPAKFNSIGVKLAHQAGVPIIPVALCTSFWGTGWPIKEFGKIDRYIPVNFDFGAPFYTHTRNHKQTHEAVMQFINSRLKAWNSESGSPHG